MAEQQATTLQPEVWAEVLTGKLKGYVVRVVRQDQEQTGFWWCIWQDNTKQMVVPRERLLSAGQLKAIGKELPRG